MDFTNKNRMKKPAQRRTVDGFVAGSSASMRGENHTPDVSAPLLGSAEKKTDGFTAQASIAKEPIGEKVSPLRSIDLELDMSQGIEEKPWFKRAFTKKKILKSVALFLAIAATCALLVGGFIFVKAWLATHKIFQGGGNSSTLFGTNIQPEKLRGEGDGRINVLLLGAGGGDHAGADLTDSIVIASIDPVAKDIALLSIPRDLWVSVPGYWSMKINAAYASAMNDALDEGKSKQEAQDAGFAKLEEVIQKYIGVPIHYHALVNFQAFAQGVDALGGVDVNVPKDLYDDFIMADNNNNPLIAKAGLQHFNGKQALLYAQSRYTTSDFDRGERQRLLLVALKEKIMTLGTFSNPKTVSKLIDALGDNVTVNMTLGEMLRLYEITKDIPTQSILTVGLTDEANPLVTTGTVNEQSIVQPRAGLTDFSAIQSFVRNTLRDPFLKSEDATIAILNGSGIDGLATLKADELKSYGYRVVLVDAAPTSDNMTTKIYDKTAGAKKFTKNYLEKRLNAKTTTDAVPQDILAQADFIVVLGKDADTKESN